MVAGGGELTIVADRLGDGDPPPGIGLARFAVTSVVAYGGDAGGGDGRAGPEPAGLGSARPTSCAAIRRRAGAVRPADGLAGADSGAGAPAGRGGHGSVRRAGDVSRGQPGRRGGGMRAGVRRLASGRRGGRRCGRGGLFCQDHCTWTFDPGQQITLTAVDQGLTFLGWGGDCASRGTNQTCTLTMNRNRSVTAAFDITN